MVVDCVAVFVVLPLLVVGIRFLLRRYVGEDALESDGGIHLSTKLAIPALVLIYIVYFAIRVFFGDRP